MISWVWPPDGEFNDALAQWLSERIWPGTDRSIAKPCRCMGVYRGDELIAVVAYHGWDEYAGVIEISAASTTPRWLTKPVLKEIYTAAFDRLGCQLVVQRNDEDNTRLNDILTRFGFVGHRIPRLRGKDRAEIVFTLTREQWEGNGYHG